MANKKAKKKKQSLTITPRGFGKKNLGNEISRAEACIANQRWGDAYQILSELGEQYSDERKVWAYLTEVCLELDDMQSYQRAQEHWLAIEPENSDLLYGLGFVYMVNRHPLLALQTFRRALACELDHEQAKAVKKQIPLLEKCAEEAQSNFEAGVDDWFELALLHEQGQAYLEEGEYAKALEAESQVLKRQPSFVSAQNNLSLICWAEGDSEGAIAAAQSILETAPHNIHALSNLVRFLAQLGDDAAARPYAERLKAAEEPTAWNSWTKKVEGLSYLGDDAGVVEVYEQWRADDSNAERSLETTDPLFNRLVGVALARCGRYEEAKAHWQIAAKSPLGSAIAEQNLSNIQRPIEQRHGAWPFIISGWLLPNTAEDFRKLVASFEHAHKIRKIGSVLQKFFDQHPHFVKQIPRIFERGGPEGQSFMVMLAEQIQPPELMAAIEDFALGQNGTDQLRNQAAMHAVRAGLLEKAGIRMWLKGEWREITLMAYELTGEPDTGKHSTKVTNLLAQSTDLLHERSKMAAIEAEELLKEAIALEPDAPNLLFNLSSSYLLQNRHLEAEVLIRDIHKRFPDYLFARTSLAQLHIDQGDFETAEALLKPVRGRDRFHYSEFEALMETQIELEMAKKNRQGARTFVDMWAGAAPDHPRVAYWKGQLEGNPLSRIEN